MKLTPKRLFNERMKTTAGFSILVSLSVCLALTGCSKAPEPPPQTASNEADEFAQRINGGKSAPAVAPAQPASAPVEAPPVAPPLENIATSSYAAGTATAPNSACNANAFG